MARVEESHHTDDPLLFTGRFFLIVTVKFAVIVLRCFLGVSPGINNTRRGGTL